MKFKAGDRVKILREMIGLSREEFGVVFELDYVRLKNIEQKRCRVGEDEFEKIGRLVPEMLRWLVFEGSIIHEELKNSQQKYSRLIAAKIDADQLPSGYGLNERIIWQ